MRQKEIFNRFQKFLRETDSDFEIMEHQVPIETQMEYFKYSNRLRTFLIPMESNLTVVESDYDQFVFDLQNPETSNEDKKGILSVLAVSKQIKAYRILEEFLRSADTELVDWTSMALMESRITLESELSDERLMYISTGLGGKGKKLRFYVLLISSTGSPFLAYQQQALENELSYALSQSDGEIEQFDIKGNYIEMLVLLPIQKNIKDILERVVDECNQYGNFISDTVVVTNVKKLKRDEIAQIIERHENKNTQTTS
jgi:hypothetical protein